MQRSLTEPPKIYYNIYNLRKSEEKEKLGEGGGEEGDRVEEEMIGMRRAPLPPDSTNTNIIT